MQVTQKSTATTVDAIQKLGETEELLIKKRRVRLRPGGGRARSSEPVQSGERGRPAGAGAARAGRPSTCARSPHCRDLLEKKIAQELDRAREFTKQKNKRGAAQAAAGGVGGPGPAQAAVLQKHGGGRRQQQTLSIP